MAGDLKRYPPTAHRLQRLRDAGIVPHSPALTGLCALAGVAFVGGLLWASAQGELRQFAAMCWVRPGVAGAAEAQLRCTSALLLALKWAAVLGLAGAATGWLAHLAQTGFACCSPLARARRRDLPAPRPSAGRELCLAAVGLIVVGAALARALQVLAEPSGGVADLAARVTWQALRVALPGFLSAALLDLAWRRAQSIRDAWMTETEMRDELRETESAWRRHAPGSEAGPHD